MKTLRKIVFLCYGKKQRKLCHKNCQKEQLFTSYLFDKGVGGGGGGGGGGGLVLNIIL